MAAMDTIILDFASKPQCINSFRGQLSWSAVEVLDLSPVAPSGYELSTIKASCA